MKHDGTDLAHCLRELEVQILDNARHRALETELCSGRKVESWGVDYGEQNAVDLGDEGGQRANNATRPRRLRRTLVSQISMQAVWRAVVGRLLDRTYLSTAVRWSVVAFGERSHVSSNRRSRLLLPVPWPPAT